MQSITVEIDSQKITVHESGGSGSPILLVHGNSSSGLTFRNQLHSPLGERHRLVAVDLPGHGGSDRARAPRSQYSLPGYANVIVDLCERLDLTDAVIVGWSLGGHIALEASIRLRTAAGYMIFGTPPLGFPPDMERAFQPNPAMAAGFTADLGDEAIEAYVGSFFRPGAPPPPAQFTTDVRRTDPLARAFLAEGIRPGGYEDELNAVANLRLPIAILHGEGEQLVNGDYLKSLTAPTLWCGSVQFIADAGHAPHWEQPQRFNVLLEAFTLECRRAAALRPR